MRPVLVKVELLDVKKSSIEIGRDCGASSPTPCRQDFRHIWELISLAWVSHVWPFTRIETHGPGELKGDTGAPVAGSYVEEAGGMGVRWPDFATARR